MSFRAFKVLLFILLIGIICIWLYSYNPSSVTVSLGPTLNWQSPLAVVLLLCFAAGALLVGLVALIIGAKRSLRDWRAGKQKKRLRNHQQMLSNAREQIAFGNKVEAERIFRQITAEDRGNILAWLMLAELLEEKGDLRDALQVLDRARLLHNDNFELLLRAAELNEKLGNTTAALDNIAIFLAKKPTNIAALKQAACYAAKIKRFADAVGFAKELQRILAPEERKEWQVCLASFELQRIYQASPQSSEELYQALLDFTNNYRDFPQGLAALAEVEESRQIADAAKLWSRAYELSANEEYLRRLAELWLRDNNPEKAVFAVRSAILSKRDAVVSFAGRCFLVSLLLRLEQLDEAEKELTKLKEQPVLEGMSPGRLFLLEAQILYKKGASREAFRILASAYYRKAPELFYGLATELSAGEMQKYWGSASAEEAPSPSLSTP